MYKCPISLSEPVIAVLTDTCITYDFVHLAKHIIHQGAIDPVTRLPIQAITLIRNTEINQSKINIEETCLAFMELVNIHPYIKVNGVGELSYLAEKLHPVVDFIKSLKIHTFAQNITLFHLAAHLGHLNCMKTLYDANIMSINYGYKDNITPLHIACSSSKDEIVQWLLSCEDIDPNAAQTSNQMTPLHLAVARSHLKNVALLIKNLNINSVLPQSAGFTPIDYAIHFNQKNILILLLICFPESYKSILYADKKGHVELIEVFLEYFIHEMLYKPETMQDFFEQYPAVQSCIVKYKNKIWEILQNPNNYINLSKRFSSYITDNLFDNTHYYKFLYDHFEQLYLNKDYNHPLFSIFQEPSAASDYHFFQSKSSILDKMNFCKMQNTSLTRPQSMPSFSSETFHQSPH